MAYYTFDWNKIVDASPSDFGHEKDVFNFFENWVRNTTYEDQLWNIEGNRNTLLQKIANTVQFFTKNNNCEQWKSYPINFLNNEIKKSIIDMLVFMNYKLFYYEIWKRLTKKKINKNDFTKEHLRFIHEIVSQCDIEWILQQYWKSLYDLCNDPQKRCILYSNEDLFYFWDQPFHFRTNRNKWDWNNFQTFFQRIWSSLYFPISKNIAILIELSNIENPHGDMVAYITPEWMKTSDYQFNIDIEKWKIPNDSLLWTIKYRIFSNCNRYIAWPDKEYLESIVSWYNDRYKQYYSTDMIAFVYQNTLPQLLEKYFSGLLRS